MLSTNLTPEQWFSSHFLGNLCHKSVCFSLPNEYSMQLQESYDGNKTADLVIFAESLNLEKIHQVQIQLSTEIGIHCYKPGLEMSSGFAIDALVTVLNDDNLQQKLEQIAVECQVELSLLNHRPTIAEPGILLMDMDSTVIDAECIDEIAKLAGVGDKVSAVTELAMQGKLDFAESLHSRVACLAGTPVSVLQLVRDRLPVNPGINHLLHELKEANWKLAIASGGFTFFADYLCQRLGLDFAISNQLEIVDDKLTGKVLGDVIGAQAKADTLNNLALQYGIPKSQTIALGDGANDLVMMEQAGLGVAYHAKPVVRQQADAAIRFGAADGLLAYLCR